MNAKNSNFESKEKQIDRPSFKIRLTLLKLRENEIITHLITEM